MRTRTMKEIQQLLTLCGDSATTSNLLTCRGIPSITPSSTPPRPTLGHDCSQALCPQFSRGLLRHSRATGDGGCVLRCGPSQRPHDSLRSCQDQEQRDSARSVAKLDKVRLCLQAS